MMTALPRYAGAHENFFCPRPHKDVENQTNLNSFENSLISWKDRCRQKIQKVRCVRILLTI